MSVSMDPKEGQHIGLYRIVGKIGQGGMGAVYLAEDTVNKDKRQVAIKLIRGGIGSRAILHRFLTERQILSCLDHSNIVRLLEVGSTENGLPYLVMEYVEGEPIDQYCNSHGLDTCARLELFRKVCAAVHYAHTNKVVHRDLKPNNILLTAEGVPKLLDFGISRILDPGTPFEMTKRSTTLLWLMTPEYASPEQIRGEAITPASDIYSLGVVLYRLLTGHSPYRTKSGLAYELAKCICEVKPEAPSKAVRRTVKDGSTQLASAPESVSNKRADTPWKLRRRLSGNLDKIVLMALQKEPEWRYRTGEEFSEDIRRHLAGLPIIAGQDRRGYRGAMFIMRNKAPLVLWVFLTLLFGGIAFTLWRSHQAGMQQNDLETVRTTMLPSPVSGSPRDFVLIANSPRLNPRDAITVAAWFAARPTGNNQALVNKFNHNNAALDDSYSLYVRHDGVVCWRVETVVDGAVIDNLLEGTPPQSVFDGNYHLLVGTYDHAAQLPRIYLDGFLIEHVGQDGQGTFPYASGLIVATPTELMLGGAMEYNVPAWFLNGSLDEVRIYNRALSAQEIRQLASASKPVSASPSLIAWWRGEGNAKDSAGRNDGRSVGHITFAPGKVGQAFSLGTH